MNSSNDKLTNSGIKLRTPKKSHNNSRTTLLPDRSSGANRRFSILLCIYKFLMIGSPIFGHEEVLLVCAAVMFTHQIGIPHKETRHSF
mmetsp:Transcript_97527/g.178203  ORF Transcript_97527/g.178203 Transcript_97527/m.178203 type:complete len:88 (-) Transcript_97527:1263-1526(-)